MPWLKLQLFSRWSYPQFSSREPRSSTSRKNDFAKPSTSQGRGARWSSQTGSFLVLLLALVALGSIFFAASLRLILNTQRVVAIKSRMDICAVKLATSRERFLREMSASNDYVKVTVLSVYAARAAVVLTIGAALEAERLAVAANRVAAFWQEGMIAVQQGKEATMVKCEKTPFSEENILCFASTPVLYAGLKRTRAFFPDIKNVYEWKKEKLGSVTCFLVAKPTYRTKLVLTGDRFLKQDNYSDVYKN